MPRTLSFRVRWRALLAGVLVAVLVAGCRGYLGTDDAERQLHDHLRGIAPTSFGRKGPRIRIEELGTPEGDVRTVGFRLLVDSTDSVGRRASLDSSVVHEALFRRHGKTWMLSGYSRELVDVVAVLASQDWQTRHGAFLGPLRAIMAVQEELDRPDPSASLRGPPARPVSKVKSDELRLALAARRITLPDSLELVLDHLPSGVVSFVHVRSRRDPSVECVDAVDWREQELLRHDARYRRFAALPACSGDRQSASAVFVEDSVRAALRRRGEGLLPQGGLPFGQ
jgi:hypothetical protein